jgi:hypothetical protein
MRDSSPTTTYSAVWHGVTVDSETVKPGVSHSDSWRRVNDAFDRARREA